MGLGGLQHYTIEPSDLERTKDFYCDVLGLENGDRPPLDFPGYWLYSGGTATVSSMEGRGTTITLYLPRSVDTPELETAPAPAQAPTETAGTVLLVEDETAVRDLARRMLELAGYAVVSASSGEEAERLFGDLGSVDVLVTDLVMPGMNGRELADRLRRGRPDLCVVLMSGYSGDVEALDGLRAAGAAFVEKPFTSTALVSEVRGVLDAA